MKHVSVKYKEEGQLIFFIKKDNTNTRKCSKELEKLYNKKFLKTIFGGNLFLTIVIFFICNRLLLLNSDISAYFALIPSSVPIILIYCKANLLFFEARKEFCKEEGLSLDHVSVKYKEEGQLIFSVRRDQNE